MRFNAPTAERRRNRDLLSPVANGVEPMSIITILMFLAIAASVCLVVHLVKRDKVPLWVAVALLCVIELLRTLPLGRF